MGAMSSKFPSKLYLWGYQSGGAILRDLSKLCWHVSGSSFGMNPRPSVIAHMRSFSPTLKPTHQPIFLPLSPKNVTADSNVKSRWNGDTSGARSSPFPFIIRMSGVIFVAKLVNLTKFWILYYET